ncbi:hypothetical protein [Neobacillus sp.]|uniref:hypothetical protein n=1 Tax=Neobacillus sp. TaxID=2675273 RepID=UPI0028976BDD|nr:hypothetical protein [Neobacillus sp.]
MNLSTLSNLAETKAKLMELVDVLVNDEFYSREEVAFDIINNILSLNNIENDLEKIYLNTGHMKLYKISESKAAEREKKETSTIS